MKLTTTEFCAQVAEVSSVDELRSAALGAPCLLIVEDGGMTASDDLCSFLADAPYMTALAAAQPAEELAKLFDLVIAPDSIAEYTAALFKDMTKKQASEITACFVAARKGTAADVLTAESKAFFRLIAEKTGGNANV